VYQSLTNHDYPCTNGVKPYELGLQANIGVIMKKQLRKKKCIFCLKEFSGQHHNVHHCSGKCYIHYNVKKNNVTKCWIWLGNQNVQGYGKFTKNKKTLAAHRYSYESFVENIPEGKFVLHKCDVRLCCNPKHLFLGSHADNVRDMHAKNRAKTVGINHHDNKLTVKQVLAIRKDWRSTVEIAKDYLISTSMVSDIRNRKKWKHVPEEKIISQRTYGRHMLTEQQIIAIRNDKRSQEIIANEYGLLQAYVSKIKLRKIWAEIDKSTCKNQKLN